MPLKSYLHLLLVTSGLLCGCVPQAFMHADYQSHLTAAEKAQLEVGQPVDKMHVSYWRSNPSQIYWQGPLTVTKEQGKFIFVEHGEWKQYNKAGQLISHTQHTAPFEGYNRTHVGSVLFDQYADSSLVAGAVVVHLTRIEFRNATPTDTSKITYWDYLPQQNKTLSSSSIPFDAQGKKGPRIPGKPRP